MVYFLCWNYVATSLNKACRDNDDKNTKSCATVIK